jgi:hypothetical protein
VVLGENPELRAPKPPILHLVIPEFRPFDVEIPISKPILTTEHQFFELCQYRCVIIDIATCLGFVFSQNHRTIACASPI